jgi:hypothetical protein
LAEVWAGKSVPFKNLSNSTGKNTIFPKIIEECTKLYEVPPENSPFPASIGEKRDKRQGARLSASAYKESLFFVPIG